MRAAHDTPPVYQRFLSTGSATISDRLRLLSRSINQLMRQHYREVLDHWAERHIYPRLIVLNEPSTLGSGGTTMHLCLKPGDAIDIHPTEGTAYTLYRFCADLPKQLRLLANHCTHDPKASRELRNALLDFCVQLRNCLSDHVLARDFSDVALADFDRVITCLGNDSMDSNDLLQLADALHVTSVDAKKRAKQEHFDACSKTLQKLKHDMGAAWGNLFVALPTDPDSTADNPVPVIMRQLMTDKDWSAKAIMVEQAITVSKATEVLTRQVWDREFPAKLIFGETFPHEREHLSNEYDVASPFVQNWLSRLAPRGGSGSGRSSSESVHNEAVQMVCPFKAHLTAAKDVAMHDDSISMAPHPVAAAAESAPGLFSKACSQRSGALTDVFVLPGALRTARQRLKQLFAAVLSDESSVLAQNTVPRIIAMDNAPGLEGVGTSYHVFADAAKPAEIIAPAATTPYELFKNLAHVPLAIVTIIRGPYANDMDFVRRSLKQLLQLLIDLSLVLNDDGLTETYRLEAATFIAHTVNFLNSAIAASEPVTDEAFADYNSSVIHFIENSLQAAVKTQMDAIYPAVSSLKSRMGDAWDKAEVVIPTVITVSRGSPRQQLFEHLMPAGADRIHVVQNAADIDAAHAELGRRLLLKRISSCAAAVTKSGAPPIR